MVALNVQTTNEALQTIEAIRSVMLSLCITLCMKEKLLSVRSNSHRIGGSWLSAQPSSSPSPGGLDELGFCTGMDVVRSDISSYNSGEETVGGVARYPLVRYEERGGGAVSLQLEARNLSGSPGGGGGGWNQAGPPAGPEHKGQLATRAPPDGRGRHHAQR